MLFYLMAYAGLRERIAFMLSELRAGRRKKKEEYRRNWEVGYREGLELGRAYADKNWQEWVDHIKDLPKEDWPPPPRHGKGAD